MKNSDVELIGMIPNDWSICRIKDTCSIARGGSPRPIDEYLSDNKQDISWIKIGDTIKGYKYIDKTEQNIIPIGVSKSRKVNKGDLLLTNSMSFGQPYILNIDGCIHDGWLVFSKYKNIDKLFLYYVLMSELCLIQFNTSAAGAVVENLNIDKVGNAKISVPNLQEQQLIVNFLDNKIRMIDDILFELNKQVDILEKYKKSLITKAVTKGLISDIQRKDSKVKWIGKIPQNWNIVRILNVLSMPITDGPHTTPELYDDGIPFVSAEAVSCGNGRIDFNHIRGYISQEFYTECCKKYIPQKNDIYMIKSGATTGKVSIVDTDKIFTIWSPLAVFRCKEEKMIPRFMFYSLQADSFQKQVENGWTYGTQQNIGMRTLEHLKVCCPELNEQQEIVNYLDKKCFQIDELIKDKQTQIEKMEKYKKSLIYEYVTGKKQTN